MLRTANGSHNVLLEKTVPAAPTERPEGVPEHARPVLVRSVKGKKVREWRWVWWWSVDAHRDGA